MRLDDRVCSGWFAVEHGLHQECVLSSLLFAAVLSVAYTHLKADKGWCILKTKRRGGKTTPGESALTTSLWGMLYADDVGVVSQSPEQPRKMMGVIVVVCAAFGLTVSEAKTDIMCLRTKGMPEATTVFSVEAAGQVYNQTNVFYTSGGTLTTTPTCPSRSTGAYATHGAASGSTPSNCTFDRALPSSSKSEC